MTQTTPTPSSVEAMREALARAAERQGCKEVPNAIRDGEPTLISTTIALDALKGLAEQFAENAKIAASDDGVTIPADGDRETAAQLACETFYSDPGMWGRADEHWREKWRNVADAACLAAPKAPPVSQPESSAVGRPFSEWNEDHGDVLWWKLPITEAPYCGSPLDLGRTAKAEITIGIVHHEFEAFDVGGWPFLPEDEPDLWWTPLPEPTFVRAALSPSGATEQGDGE